MRSIDPDDLFGFQLPTQLFYYYGTFDVFTGDRVVVTVLTILYVIVIREEQQLHDST